MHYRAGLRFRTYYDVLACMPAFPFVQDYHHYFHLEKEKKNDRHQPPSIVRGTVVVGVHNNLRFTWVVACTQAASKQGSKAKHADTH